MRAAALRLTVGNPPQRNRSRRCTASFAASLRSLAVLLADYAELTVTHREKSITELRRAWIRNEAAKATADEDTSDLVMPDFAATISRDPLPRTVAAEAAGVALARRLCETLESVEQLLAAAPAAGGLALGVHHAAGPGGPLPPATLAGAVLIQLCLARGTRPPPRGCMQGCSCERRLGWLCECAHRARCPSHSRDAQRPRQHRPAGSLARSHVHSVGVALPRCACCPRPPARPFGRGQAFP